MNDPSTSRSHGLLYAFAPFLYPRTYGSLLYVWFSFPLGLVYFVGLSVGLLVGGALTLIWIGLLLLFVTFLGAWAAEGLERQLANRLLGARVPPRRDDPAPGVAPRGWFGGIFFGPALWKGLLFLGIKFPLGLAGWIASVASLAVSLAFLAVPLLYPFTDLRLDLELDSIAWPLWTIGSFAAALAIGLVGLLGLVVTLHLHNALGWIWARLAEMLLGARLPESAPERGALPAAS